jgi:hypothetical protein
MESLAKIGVQGRASRTPAGWVTESFAPPATRYPYVGFGGAIDWSSDVKNSLWNVTRREDVGTLEFVPIVREEDGTFVEAGPALNDGTYTPAVVGSSRNHEAVITSSVDRPALTGGVVDTRLTTRRSLLKSTRDSNGQLTVRQVAFASGATMAPACEAQLGGSTATSARGSVSDDGSRIFFTFTGSLACNNAINQRVWVKSGDADPVDVSAPRCTVPSDCGVAQRALFEGAARDGSRVFFTTEHKLVDGDQDTSAKNDLYEFDLDAPGGGRLIPITASLSPNGAGVVRVTRVSDDGSRVYFVATGRPLAGQNSRGIAPVSGQSNLYVYQRDADEVSGAISFVGALDPSDSVLWQPDNASRPAQTSVDGRFLIFASSANLTGDRLPGDVFKDIFRFDAATDTLTRIWSDRPENNGAARTDGPYVDAYFGDARTGGLQRFWHPGRQISDDGSKILFDTSEALSPDDVNTERDTYLWRAETGQITMLSSGRSGTPARAAGMTPSGSSLFLSTSEPLVKAHTSGAVAVYAVRQGGGLPDPPLPEEDCEGDGCQGELGGVPDFGFGIPSASLRGPGNEAAGPPTAGVQRLTVGPVGSAARRAAARSGRLVVPVSVSAATTVTAHARARVGSGRSTKVRRVASTTRQIRRGGKASLHLRLSASARKSLRRSGRLTVTIEVSTRSVKAGKTIKVVLRKAQNGKGDR